jgi:hypothetical protein
MSMPSIGLQRQYDNKQFAVFGTILAVIAGCFPSVIPPPAASKKSEFSPPKLVWSLFFRCIISDISQRLETASEAIARGPA